ncbi:MAG: TIGR03087 family PEP-CTERM/XrtA system glycosyltransferase [Pseudomonadota bacterium]
MSSNDNKDTRPDLLFLVHRIPFPPNKGDKIRSFNMLAFLSRHYRVHLGCFIDDPADNAFVDELREYCASQYVININPTIRKVRSLAALITGAPLSVPFYASKNMQSWVDRTIGAHSISRVVCFSSPMAQFVGDLTESHSVMDFVDVDSDKWRQYAERTGLPMRLVYRREWHRLADYERDIAGRFAVSTFVTQNEVTLFNRISPETAARHHAVRNGVDTEYLDPAVAHPSPYPEAGDVITFVGMMDYWANVEAVSWFARDVLPAIRAKRPKAEFWIVGGSPTAEVRALADLEGVHVTGRVEDVRPYMQHADVAVAPLRIARGVQNKVLEYLSMGTPTVCSTQAAQGLEASDSAPMLVAETASEMAMACCRLMDATEDPDQSASARRYVLQYYNWERNLGDLRKLIERGPSQDSIGL